jgi:hypothetical protein
MPAMASSASGGASAPVVVNLTMNYTMPGGASGDDFVKLAREHGREVARIVEEILERKARGEVRVNEIQTYEIQNIFAALDQRHFGSKLCKAGYRAEIAWVDRTREPDDYRQRGYGENIGRCLAELRLIQIDLSVRDPNEARETILHEMVHASVELDRPLRKNEDQHGTRFWRELERVYLDGEWLLEEEVFFYCTAINRARGVNATSPFSNSKSLISSGRSLIRQRLGSTKSTKWTSNRSGANRCAGKSFGFSTRAGQLAPAKASLPLC